MNSRFVRHFEFLRRRGLVASALAIGLLISSGGCSGGLPGTGRGGPPAYQSPDEADLRYGAAPRRHPDVTYQPDVVIVGGGGRSVRSVTDDGLTWRLDPAAEGAGELTAGKVMFVTGRGVGRVLDIRRDGNDLAVTIGPVAITEVIRDGKFGSDRPISFEQVITYQVGEPAWAATEGESGDAKDGTGGTGGGTGSAGTGGTGGGTGSGLVPAAFVEAGPRAVAPPAPPKPGNRPAQPPPRKNGPAPASIGGFTVTPTCCSGGAGARFGYDKGGVRLAGEAAFIWKKPSGKFNLEIDGGSITTANFQISGGAGLRLKIAGASAVGSGHNIDPVLKLPVDFTVPLGIFLGVPFSATVNQTLNITTAFSAKNGNIEAEGEWSLGGTFGFGYANGSFGLQKPKFAAKNKIADSIHGISVGVNGIIVVYQARFHVGIGAFGFNTGLYAGLTASVGLTIGSAAGSPIEVCRSAQVGVWLNYGVGYTMPVAVQKVINLILRLFDAKPIERQGGIGSTENVFNSFNLVPDVPICRG